MTRKDYVAIAAGIRAEVEAGPNKNGSTALQRVAERIAEVMAQDNPRFDRARFLKACGVQP